MNELQKTSERLRILEALRADPAADPQTIAEKVGCKRGAVTRVIRDISDRLHWRAEELIESYQQTLLTALPLEARADALRQIVGNHEDDPHAAIKAIQHADKVGGLLTETVMHTGPNGGPIETEIKITLVKPE